MPASVSRAVRLPGGCAAGVAFISVGSTHTGQSMARYTVMELSSSTTPVSPTAGSVSFVAIFSSLLFAISSLARRFFSIMRALTIQIERPASAGPRPAGGASTGDVQSPESFYPGKGRAVSLDRPPLSCWTGSPAEDSTRSGLPNRHVEIDETGDRILVTLKE